MVSVGFIKGFIRVMSIIVSEFDINYFDYRKGPRE